MILNTRLATFDGLVKRFVQGNCKRQNGAGMLQKFTTTENNIILFRRMATITAGVLLGLAMMGTMVNVFSIGASSEQAGIAMIDTGLSILVLMGICGGVLLLGALLVVTCYAHQAEHAWQRWGGALVQIVIGLWMSIAALTMANKGSAIPGFLMLLASGLSWLTAGGCSAALLWAARQAERADAPITNEQRG